MFQYLNLAAGILHTILFLVIVVTSQILRKNGRTTYILRFSLKGSDVPEPPQSCLQSETLVCGPADCNGAKCSSFCDLFDSLNGVACQSGLDRVSRFEQLERSLVSETTAREWDLASVIAAFPLITALFHFAIATPWLNVVYSSQIKAGRNPFRWVEYSITASIMLVAIAGLSGIRDLDTVRQKFALMLGVNIFGLSVEDAYAGGRKWTASLFFAASSFMLLASYWPILRSFREFSSTVEEKGLQYRAFFNTFFSQDFPGNSQESNEPFTIPSFVKYAVYGIFVLYLTFPLIMLYRLVTGASYASQERNFLIASFVSKAFLVIAVASGIVREDAPEYLKEPGV